MKRLAHYSQYFLRSPKLIKELVGHAKLRSTDTVYDIGAGSGAISAVLAGVCGKVISIEAESRMAEKLRQNMRQYSNVAVHEGDFLAMNLPNGPYKVFANIPFHISSQIVRKLVEAKNVPEVAYLVVQKQFANKLLPQSERFTGQLGMMIGPIVAVRIRKRLRRTDFWPHPNVDTVLLELKRRDTPLLPVADMPSYRAFIEGCFSDPKIFARTPQRAVGLPEGVRPSQMQLEQWLALFAAARTKRR